MIKWKTAVYLRLSNEDNEKVESNSITNQRVLIQNYIKKDKDMKINDYYIDDGISGTSFDRPEFQRMIKDITNGKINTVIVKDLSRFGRNYVESGNYLESIFPMYNVRFIAINDNIDSLKDPEGYESMIVPIKNLMNDQYARDISIKVRSVLNAKKQSGQFIGAKVPYGYLRNPINKHKFIIDKVTSKIVKKIYKDIIKGNSMQEIVSELNETNILTPEMYRKVNNQASISKIENKEWNTRMVERILNNETYTGKLMQNKKRRISHKLHKSVNLDKTEWIVIDKHHEAIINKETFELANQIIKGKEVKISRVGNYDLFAGYLKCNECGSSFVKRVSKNNTKYYCAHYYRNKLCTNHKINKEDLESIILKVINHQISLVIDFEKEVDIYSSLNDNSYDYDIYMDQLNIIEKGISKYKILKEEIVLDLESNFIDHETFSEYRDDYNNSIKELEKSKIILEEKLQKLDGSSIKNIEWINIFKKYNNIEKLDRNILNNLIERIIINEKGNINVIFKYQNEFYSALDFINRSKCDII